MPNYYLTVDGERVSQRVINSRLSATYKGMMLKYVCEGCGIRNAQDHDHTISQKRCKELHKTELIWTEGNICFSCRQCHEEWEGYKSGAFEHHLNAKKRLTYTAIFDDEGIRKRMNYVQSGQLLNYLENLLNEEI